jgi:hypothetical protein
VFDGDPQPLFSVIEAEHADPSCARACSRPSRCSCSTGGSRDEVARYLRDAFSNLRPHEDNFVWYGWQSAVVGLGLGELSSLVGKAFARGLIDPLTMTFEEFKEDLRHARVPAAAARNSRSAAWRDARAGVVRPAPQPAGLHRRAVRRRAGGSGAPDRRGVSAGSGTRAGLAPSTHRADDLRCRWLVPGSGCRRSCRPASGLRAKA